MGGQGDVCAALEGMRKGKQKGAEGEREGGPASHLPEAKGQDEAGVDNLGDGDEEEHDVQGMEGAGREELGAALSAGTLVPVVIFGGKEHPPPASTDRGSTPSAPPQPLCYSHPHPSRPGT